MNITRRFKSYFLRGLAVLLPTMLTLWIFAKAYQFIQDNIAIYINKGLVQLLLWMQGMDGPSKESLTKIFVDGAGSVVGFLIALACVFLVGALLASVMGRALWRIVEVFIGNTPFLRRVYPYIKQITDFLLTQEDQQQIFSRVVAVEYPRKGAWSLGFVTGSGLRRISESVHQELLTVLISTSPTPITGYVVVVPKDETIALDMTVEEAFRFLVSGGVISPSGQPQNALPGACGGQHV